MQDRKGSSAHVSVVACVRRHAVAARLSDGLLRLRGSLEQSLVLKPIGSLEDLEPVARRGRIPMVLVEREIGLRVGWDRWQDEVGAATSRACLVAIDYQPTAPVSPDLGLPRFRGQMNAYVFLSPPTPRESEASPAQRGSRTGSLE